MAKWPYSTRQWRRLRLVILARDFGRCQIRGPKCTRTATVVDHIEPVADAPHRAFDPSNLRAACKPCNETQRIIGYGKRLEQQQSNRRQW